MSTSIVTDPTLLQSINAELKDPGRPWDLSWSGSSVQLNSKSELTIQEQQMKYSAVCNMLAAVYAKQATRQLGGLEALVWVGLDLVDFARPLVSARCHVSTWSSSSLLTRSSLSTALSLSSSMPFLCTRGNIHQIDWPPWSLCAYCGKKLFWSYF